MANKAIIAQLTESGYTPVVFVTLSKGCGIVQTKGDDILLTLIQPEHNPISSFIEKNTKTAIKDMVKRLAYVPCTVKSVEAL